MSHRIIRLPLPLIRTLLNSRKRNIEQPRLDLMEYHLNVNLAREAQPISGSFCSNCFRYVLKIFLWTLFTEYIFLGQRELSQVHQVGQQGEGHLQAGGQQGGVQAVGDAQEQA